MLKTVLGGLVLIILYIFVKTSMKKDSKDSQNKSEYTDNQQKNKEKKDNFLSSKSNISSCELVSNSGQKVVFKDNKGKIYRLFNENGESDICDHHSIYMVSYFKPKGAYRDYDGKVSNIRYVKPK